MTMDKSYEPKNLADARTMANVLRKLKGNPHAYNVACEMTDEELVQRYKEHYASLDAWVPTPIPTPSD